jgi:hypothetical protein
MGKFSGTFVSGPAKAVLRVVYGPNTKTCTGNGPPARVLRPDDNCIAKLVITTSKIQVLRETQEGVLPVDVGHHEALCS